MTNYKLQYLQMKNKYKYIKKKLNDSNYIYNILDKLYEENLKLYKNLNIPHFGDIYVISNIFFRCNKLNKKSFYFFIDNNFLFKKINKKHIIILKQIFEQKYKYYQHNLDLNIIEYIKKQSKYIKNQSKYINNINLYGGGDLMFINVIVAIFTVIIFIILSSKININSSENSTFNINAPNVTPNCGACGGASWLLHIEGCPLYNKDDECPVCMSNVANSITKCGHKFCSTCLDTIMYQTNMCPLCRSILM